MEALQKVLISVNRCDIPTKSIDNIQIFGVCYVILKTEARADHINYFGSTKLDIEETQRNKKLNL